MDESVERYLRRVEERYRRIAAQLDTVELQTPAAQAGALAEEDLLGPDGGRSQLFAGYYSEAGLRDALGRYGFLEKIARAAWCQESDLRLSFDLSDPYHHALHIHNGEPCGETLLVELRVHLREQPREAQIGGAGGFVCIEWLLLQNPTRPFSKERPRLPGQLHPGLGVGAEVQTLLTIMAGRLGRRGLLAYPAFCHTAVIYSMRFRFVSPAAEGRFQALLRDGAGLPLDVLSWAVELGCVRNAKGEPVGWMASEELLPLSPAAQAHFETPEYQATRDAWRERSRYVIDLSLLDERRAVAEGEAEAIGRRAYEAAVRAQGASRSVPRPGL